MTGADFGVQPSSALSCDYCGWMQRFDGNGSPENLSRAASVRGWAVSVRVGFSHMTLCPYCERILLGPVPPVQHMFPCPEVPL